MLRGAVLSRAFQADTHYTGAVSNGSPLFKLPVDAVQRGRDHGLPTYNAARLVSEWESCCRRVSDLDEESRGTIASYVFERTS